MAASSTAASITTADPSSTTQTEIFECSKHAGRVLNRMFGLLESLLLCDVELIADDDGTRIHSHRLVLSASSDYFLAMFTGKLRESKESQITLKEINGEDLKKLLQFCYTGRIELCENNVESLLYAANMLQFDTVETACSDFLDRHMHPSNCLGISLFAEQHGLESLQKKAEDYTCKNFMEVCETDEFLKLSVIELRKLFLNEDIIVDTEEIMFTSLMKWIEYDKENRKKHLYEFLSDVVKLWRLEPSFIYKHVKPVCKTIKSKLIILDAMQWHFLPEERLNIDRYKERKTNPSLMAIFGGNNGISLQRYCLKTKNWSLYKSYSQPILSDFGVAEMGNKVFIVGGFQNNQTTNTLYSVDIKTSDCVKLSDMSTNRRLMGVAVLGGMLYAVGGYDDMIYGSTAFNYGNTVLNTVEKWNPTTGNWSNVSPIMQARYDVRVITLNGLLYAIGGLNNENYIKSVECYDPRTNAWTAKAPMNITPGNFDVAAVNGYIYAVNGEPLNKVERYDPATNIWTSMCSINVPMVSVTCTVLCGRLILTGSCGNVQEYDPNTNKCLFLGKQQPPLPYNNFGFNLLYLTNLNI